MVKTGYQMEVNGPQYARAMTKNQAVSLKYTTEICRAIKGQPVEKAVQFLEDVLAFKRFVPFRRYYHNTAHRKGDFPVKVGRYPRNASKAVLAVIHSAKNNAIAKGLDESKLLIVHASAGQGFARTFLQSKGHIGGKSRVHKSSHIEVVVHEGKGFARSSVSKTKKKEMEVSEKTKPETQPIKETVKKTTEKKHGEKKE